MAEARPHPGATMLWLDLGRVERIGEYWGHPETRSFGELLIDLEEDKAAKAVVFGLLAEMSAEGSCP
jgi:hypothetical protein